MNFLRIVFTAVENSILQCNLASFSMDFECVRGTRHNSDNDDGNKRNKRPSETECHRKSHETADISAKTG